MMLCSNQITYFATNIPMPKMMHCNTSYLTINHAAKKNATPSTTAIIVIINTKRSNSNLNGLRGVSLDEAKLAI